MKSGMTRWKIVPLYRGTPCILRRVAGAVQSFVPFARPMKFATPIGALSGNSVQVSFPAVVSMIAVGWLGVIVVAGFFTVEVVGWVAVCAASATESRVKARTRRVRISAPERNTETALYDTSPGLPAICGQPVVVRS